MKYMDETARFFAGIHLLLSINLIASHSKDRWCQLDSGQTTITDSLGYRHSVRVSVTRDGSVWLRLGRDYEAFDWALVAQRRTRVQAVVLDDDMIDTLHDLPFVDFCVLTDLRFELSLDGGWHPSYVTVYEPRTRETRIVSLKNHRDCKARASVQLTADGQGFQCSGPDEISVCGLRNVPQRGQRSPTWFIKYVNLDLASSDHWFCTGHEENNFYTFSGSFYYAFVKLANCDRPEDSRTVGYDAKLRSNKDSLRNAVVIGDPTQSILAASVVQAWQFYAQIVSEQHPVFLQIWRPTRRGPAAAAGSHHHHRYALVGQTPVHPTELRFHELALTADQFVRTEAGDVVGLYFPEFNPIGWSAVPCASPDQRHRVLENAAGLAPGRAFHFKTIASSTDACRHYSVKALFANKTGVKSVEGWICPTKGPFAASVDQRSGSAELKKIAEEKKQNTFFEYDSLDAWINSTVDFPSEEEEEEEEEDEESDGRSSVYAQPELLPASVWDSVVDPSEVLVFVVLFGLLLTMTVVGLVSYYRAVHV